MRIFSENIHVHMRAKFGLTLISFGVLIQSNRKNTVSPILIPKILMSKFLNTPMGAGLDTRVKFYPNLCLVQFSLTQLDAQDVNRGRIWHTAY